MTQTLELVALSSLRPHPGNPKAHDADLLDRSLTEFGYIEPVVIDARTGLLISGHGRRESLTRAKESGAPPPEGVTIGPDGEWLIPAVTGWASRDDLHAEAALVTLNRIGERGGWDDHALLAILDHINDEADLAILSATGFDSATIEILRRGTEADDVFGVSTEHLLDEFKAISGQEESDYHVEYAHKCVVYFRDNAAIEDFSTRLGLLTPLGRDLNYPLDWTPNDRRRYRNTVPVLHPDEGTT